MSYCIKEIDYAQKCIYVTYEELQELFTIFKSISNGTNYCYESRIKKFKSKNLQNIISKILIYKTNFTYEGKKEILLPSIDNWGAQMVNSIKNLINLDRTQEIQGQVKNPNEIYKNLLYNTATIRGTMKEIFQSGQSFVRVEMTSSVKRSIRGYIYASDLPTDILGFPHHLAEMLLDTKLQKDTIYDLPDQVGLFIKRDPVLWSGGIVAITKIFTTSQQGDSFGVSPYFFENMHADIDGDTLVLYVGRGRECREESLVGTHTFYYPFRLQKQTVSKSHQLAFSFACKRFENVDQGSVQFYTACKYFLPHKFANIIIEESKKWAPDCAKILNSSLKKIYDLFGLDNLNFFKKLLDDLHIYSKSIDNLNLKECELLNLTVNCNIKSSKRQLEDLSNKFQNYNKKKTCTNYREEELSKENQTEIEKFIHNYIFGSQKISMNSYRLSSGSSCFQYVIYDKYTDSLKILNKIIQTDVYSFLPSSLLIDSEILSNLYSSDKWFE